MKYIVKIPMEICKKTNSGRLSAPIPEGWMAEVEVEADSPKKAAKIVEGMFQRGVYMLDRI